MNEAGVAVVVSMRDEASAKMQNFGKTMGQTRVEAINFRVAILAVGGVLSQTASLLGQLDDPMAKAASGFLRMSGYAIMTVSSIMLVIPKIKDLITWLQSLAAMQAVVAALSGPVGWASLGIAAAVGAGAYFGTKALTTPKPEPPGLSVYGKQIVEAAQINVKIEGGPLLLQDDAAMKRFAEKIMEAQRQNRLKGR